MGKAQELVIPEESEDRQIPGAYWAVSVDCLVNFKPTREPALNIKVADVCGCPPHMQAHVPAYVCTLRPQTCKNRSEGLLKTLD